MKITGKKGIGSKLKTTLQIALYGGMIIIAILPFILKTVEVNLTVSILIIYPNGVILLIIMNQFIKLFDSLKNNNPFCENNVKILKNTGKVAIIGSTFWLLDLLYKILLLQEYNVIFILAMIFLSILFLGVSIALYILAELFKEATQYKTENELTI